MSVIKNTLYVTKTGAALYKDHETIIVKVDGEKQLQLPLIGLESIVLLGSGYVSPDLMSACLSANIHIAFFSVNGRFLARVEGIPGGSVILRRQQYRASDNVDRTTDLARSFVLGKLVNTRLFLRHARRDASEDRKEAIEAVCTRLALHIQELARTASIDSMRGIEGIAAKEYFACFDLLIKRDEGEFRFENRSRRPPKNRLNALLSFGYMLLTQTCAAALASVGLDPAVGFLHEDRPGRLSLALDLMEELRAPVVDRLVVALVNRNQLDPADFGEDASGGWRLTDEARKMVLTAYQEGKQVEVRHDFLEQTLPWGKIPHIQAQLLARTIRGDLPTYPPFCIR